LAEFFYSDKSDEHASGGVEESLQRVAIRDKLPKDFFLPAKEPVGWGQSKATDYFSNV